MCLPSSAPSYPMPPAVFSRNQLDALRHLLATASVHESFNAIVRDVDAKSLSKFVHGQTSLDWRMSGPNIQAVFVGVYHYFKRRASEELRRDFAPLLTRVFLPRHRNRIEDFSRTLHYMFGVPDTGDEPEHDILPGLYWAYRYDDVIDGIPSIVKSALRIESHKSPDHSCLFFKLVYRHDAPDPDLGLRPMHSSRSVGRVHGVVLAKQKHLFIQGRDDQGDVPFLAIADRPSGRPNHIAAVFSRVASGGLGLASRLLFVRRDICSAEEPSTFRRMYGDIGVYPADQLIRDEGLSALAWALDNRVGPELGTAAIWQALKPTRTISSSTYLPFGPSTPLREQPNT